MNRLNPSLLIVLAGCALVLSGEYASAQSAGTVLVDADAKHVLNSFDPDRALGSSLDVLSRTGIDKVHSPHIVQESLSAGWGPITYRNNTELRMAAWHWTENGTWSDAAHQSGYFTGSTELKGADAIHSLSHADPDGPPSAMIVTGNPQGTFVLPRASITVLRGKVAAF